MQQMMAQLSGDAAKVPGRPSQRGEKTPRRLRLSRRAPAASEAETHQPRGTTAHRNIAERIWRRLVDDENGTPNPPWAAGAFLALSLVYAIAAGGYFTPVWTSFVGALNGVVSSTGLSAEKVAVVGRNHTSMDDN